ncbi:hypothetical protein PsorP6_010594 [Peronosclerospora sorghi]|uniref:Uncharacterized protein n=1 Tax=Peronosclerospora sorghi TaxID=230839 RepID=A0ACC0VWD2_9STRA|nr:hypothetical protein PsorP6_010594 [Peronosclerospora sorghi]
MDVLDFGRRSKFNAEYFDTDDDWLDEDDSHMEDGRGSYHAATQEGHLTEKHGAEEGNGQGRHDSVVASFQWPRHTSDKPVEKVPMLMTTMLVTTLACMVTSWSSESWSVVQMEVVMALRKRSEKGCTFPTARGIGLNTVVPLAPHSQALDRTTAYLLEKEVLYAVTPSRGAKINPFVQQYYLTFLLGTIAAVLVA